MGILNSLFSGNEKKEDGVGVEWNALTQLEQISEIKEKSKSKTVLVFKHSTRCGISRMTLKQFENNFTENLQSIQFYYLDLLNHRDISNQLAQDFQVMHQSPQILVIKNETAVANASHYDITQLDLTTYL